MFTVVERRPVSEDLALASNDWLMRNRLDPEVDESWLELVCEDGEIFRPDNIMLHLAVPPCDVAPGEEVDPRLTQGLAEVYPEPGAPAETVPKFLALARTFERTDNVWVGICKLPGPTRELFTVEPTDAMLAVMNATRRTLNRGMMSISGDPRGTLTFAVVEDEMAAWGSTEAEVPEAFTYWVDAGPATALAKPLKDATRVVGGIGPLSDIIITNDQGVEGRCLFIEELPAPVQLAEDHFETQADGRVEGLSFDRPGGLGRDALAAIADLRPGGVVTFALSGDGSLAISGGSENGGEFVVPGPGFSAAGNGSDVSVAVPYPVALAVYDGAVGGTVDLLTDDRWGRVHRADQGITVQWRR